MSIEHDQSTRHQMRAGISGGNVLPPLDEFSVTQTITDKTGAPIDLGSYWDGLLTAEIHATLNDIARESIASGIGASLWSVDSNGQLQIKLVSIYTAPHKHT